MQLCLSSSSDWFDGLTNTRPLSMTFQPPRKFILTKLQLDWFQTSETHKNVISYIETLNESVVSIKLTDPCDESEVTVPEPRIDELFLKNGCS